MRDHTWGAVAAGALAVFVGLCAVDGMASADEPPVPTADLRQLADDPVALRARLEAGERLSWQGPAHLPTLVLPLNGQLVLLERGLRDLDALVSLRREGAFLVVEGPATLRRERDTGGARRLDAAGLLGLPWTGSTQAPPAAAPVPPDGSHLEMVEGDASIARVGTESAAVNVNRGEQAPLIERDAALLGEFAEGNVDVGGSTLTLLEHTSLRVLSIGETSSVVEVLGVELELQRGTVISAAFGSLVLNILRGAATVRPGTAAEGSEIRITNVDPGTGIETTTTIKLAPGQEFGVSPTGVWTTSSSSSPVSVTVTMSVPTYGPNGEVVGRETVTTYDGQAPVGSGPSVPVLVDAIVRVMGSAAPDQVGPLVKALQNGQSVTDLGLQSLVTNYVQDPDVANSAQGALSHLGSRDSSSNESDDGAGPDDLAGGDDDDDDDDGGPRTITVFFTDSLSNLEGTSRLLQTTTRSNNTVTPTSTATFVN